jgi:hypothetical protein
MSAECIKSIYTQKCAVPVKLANQVLELELESDATYRYYIISVKLLY